jgi:hypothetical protein
VGAISNGIREYLFWEAFKDAISAEAVDSVFPRRPTLFEISFKGFYISD